MFANELKCVLAHALSLLQRVPLLQCANFSLPNSKLQVDRYRMCLLNAGPLYRDKFVRLRFARLKCDWYTVVYENFRQRNVTLQLNLPNSNATEAHDLPSRMENKIYHFPSLRNELVQFADRKTNTVLQSRSSTPLYCSLTLL